MGIRDCHPNHPTRLQSLQRHEKKSRTRLQQVLSLAAGEHHVSVPIQIARAACPPDSYAAAIKPDSVKRLTSGTPMLAAFLERGFTQVAAEAKAEGGYLRL